MDLFMSFLRKKAPRPGKEIPQYLHSALVITEGLFAVYFPITTILFFWGTYQQLWVPFAMFALAIVGMLSLGRIPVRASIGLYAAVTVFWCAWYIHFFGWGCGGQHFLIPMLILLFFNIYDPPWLKIIYFFAALLFRMGLFAYSLNHTPVFTLDQSISIAFQTLNSLTFLVMLACLCILFSSNLQETERKLRLDNQELHKEAGTDPLTQLPNRRAMLDTIKQFQRHSPEEPFSVAIADIDFFKRVNDTYGHNCGDYTLQTLAALFREKAGESYTVCRWGGEEFCFFLPGKNLDTAGAVMQDICVSTRRMPLRFEAHEFSITITIGVEENDFVSPLDEILKAADRKLYMGKNSGRNQLVI